MQVKPVPALRGRYLFLKARALLLLVAGKRAAALPVFQRMLQLSPSDRYALASLAHLQMQLNQIDEAVASLQLLARMTGPGVLGAASWFNLGFVLQHAGRAGEAASAFQHALALEPKLDRAWYGLALVLMQQRQFQGAAEALKKNTALQPMSPHGWYRLAQVWLALGEQDKALKVIEHLRHFEPRVAAQLERENGLIAASRNECQERRTTTSSGAMANGARDAVH